MLVQAKINTCAFLSLMFLAQTNILMRAYIIFFTCLAATAAPLRAAEQQAVRPLSTDRPDTTESTHTVDAGHFQIESDLVAFSHDRDTGGGGPEGMGIGKGSSPSSMMGGRLRRSGAMVSDTCVHRCQSGSAGLSGRRLAMPRSRRRRYSSWLVATSFQLGSRDLGLRANVHSSAIACT